MRVWVAALALQAALAGAAATKHHRRSMANQATLPLSKGGWRPVVGSGGHLYGSFGTAPLHAPSYKLPTFDLYPSSARPIAARDATKLTSIAQSYRPTTHRTLPSAAPTPANQPINSYLNPFSLPNNGLNHYKFIQNFPVDSVLIRNPHNQYSARPVLQKYQSKPKQNPFQNNVYQQLTNIQPIQFGQYQTAKPLDVFGKPIEVYARPDGLRRPQSAEIYKAEVYKLPDNEVAPQSLSQQVKTAHQQTYGGAQKFTVNPYANYAFQDSLPNYQQFPASILGTFGSFGVQSVKARDPVFSTTKTTYLPPQPNKQTIFNSFSYSGFKSTPTFFSTTTPKLLTTPNQYNFGSTLNDLRAVPTPQTKVTSPPKIDPNVGTKGAFKPSPQDPFSKNRHNLDYNKITTYNPPLIQSTTATNTFYHDYDQYTGQQNYISKPIVDYRYELNNHRVNDNVGVNQQVSQQYTNPPSYNFQLEDTNNFSPYKSTYEVTENEDDIITHSSPGMWAATPPNNNQKTTEDAVTTSTKTTTAEPIPELPEEYAIVTEGEQGYEHSLNYDSQVESQSRRPLGDDFEPIGKHKLKDYYYKVSTPNYGDHSGSRRTKKPTETSRYTQQDTTTTTTTAAIDIKDVEDLTVEALPTLPPNKHFKRPSTPEPQEKDRPRKRNKIRRRRPPLANGSRFREENSTRKTVQSTSTTTTEEPQITTEQEEVHTIRPRVRPSKLRTESSLTTPTITTDLTTSALPTISPTTPTVVKKMGQRKPSSTTTEKLETTTQSTKDDDQNRDSSIMKITSRPQFSRNTYEAKSSEVPDFSHKQDEKDTPTSDVSVSLSDTLKTTSESLKDFSFHRDVRPFEITTTETLKETSKNGNEVPTTSQTETRNSGKVQRPRLKNKYDRPRFSVKEYKNRMSSTTSTTETPIDTPKIRFPQRKIPYSENGYKENENTTERKKFTPKDPRYKANRTESNEQFENVSSTKQSGRQRLKTETTVETESSTQKMSSRIRNGQRRPRPTEEPVEAYSPATVHNKRPMRKKIKDSDISESVQDVTVTETTPNIEHRSDITSERSRSESAIMKIADKKHQDHLEHIFEHSKRVSDLTLAASKDYNTPGMFKAVSTNSRRIPNYFTIATDDPILPIEAFFPQLNQKKES